VGAFYWNTLYNTHHSRLRSGLTNYWFDRSNCKCSCSIRHYTAQHTRTSLSLNHSESLTINGVWVSMTTTALRVMRVGMGLSEDGMTILLWKTDSGEGSKCNICYGGSVSWGLVFVGTFFIKWSRIWTWKFFAFLRAQIEQSPMFEPKELQNLNVHSRNFSDVVHNFTLYEIYAWNPQRAAPFLGGLPWKRDIQQS